MPKCFLDCRPGYRKVVAYITGCETGKAHAAAMLQDDDIPGIVRYHTYEVLKQEVNNPRLRWAYLPYSMHMAGPREAIQHMIIRKNYGTPHLLLAHSRGSPCCLRWDAMQC